MSQNPEELYSVFDTAEQRCVDAEAKVEQARTRFGRWIAEIRLESRRRDVQETLEQHETAEMLAVSPSSDK